MESGDGQKGDFVGAPEMRRAGVEKQAAPEGNALAKIEGMGAAMWHTLVEEAPNPILTVGRDGTIQYANRTPSGVPTENVIGKSVDVVIPAEHRSVAREAVQQVLETGRTCRFEIRAHDQHDHQARWLVRASPVMAGAEVDSVALFYCDARDHETTSSALHDSLEFNRTVLSASPVGIATYGPDGQCVSGNEAIARMVGASMEQVLSQNFLKIESWRRSGLLDDAKTCLADGVSRRREIRVQSTFGKDVWLDCRLSRFLSAGQPHLLLIVDDISERRETEEERRRLQAKLQHAQKLESLGVLAGGIAHDFNNLLTGVLGNATLAKTAVSPCSPVWECIDEIEQASRRAAELCGEMLAYAGRGKFLTERLDLSATVREITVLLESAISKGAVLELDLASDLPAIEADGAQIRQVVMNLVINASEALDDGGGRITVRTRAEVCDEACLCHETPPLDLPKGLYARLDVIDDGCGMDQETRTRIFDPFFTTKFAGRGLGLAAAQGIVRSHEGGIQIDTEPGVGTRVRVWLPALEEEPALAEPRSPAAPEPAKARGLDRTVLVVDDEPLVLSLARRVLEQGGYEVLVARDGREAVKVYEEHHEEIDVVVLDLTMPGMRGDEAAHELQRIRGDVRVVLSSGFSEEEATAHFATLGLSGFLQKPYAAGRLVQTVETALEGT